MSKSSCNKWRAAWIFSTKGAINRGKVCFLGAMEVPVIATAWGGPVDHLDSSCGILVEPSSKEAFVRDLSLALDATRHAPAGSVGLERRRHVDIELHSIGSAQITLWNYFCFFSLIRTTRDIGAKTRGAFALLPSRCSSTRSYGRDYRIRSALKDSPPIGELPTTLRPYPLAAR